MLIHKDKSFERISTHLNDNFSDDKNAAIIDETTPEGLKMACNVILWYPYYTYTVDENNFVTSVLQKLLPEFMNASEVDAEVVRRIRLKYSIDDEFKMQNKGIDNSQDIEYVTYRQYVQECKDWGTAKKKELGLEV